MRKNLYTKTINDIKISENAVNSAIENIYSKQSNDNIIDIKKSKNKKVNKVIAASLVAAMLVSGGRYTFIPARLPTSPSASASSFLCTAPCSRQSPCREAHHAPLFPRGRSRSSLSRCCTAFRRTGTYSCHCRTDTD